LVDAGCVFMVVEVGRRRKRKRKRRRRGRRQLEERSF
jgi:hypothetical protein